MASFACFTAEPSVVLLQLHSQHLLLESATDLCWTS